MLPREFDRRLRAWRARAERESEERWNQTLFLWNQLGRGFGGKDFEALSLDDFKRKAALRAGVGPTKAEYLEDLKRRDRLFGRHNRAKA
jgi:hypothetical protein